MRNSSGPLPLPALISAPMSVLRAVMTPSNGATIRLKDVNACKRSTFARSALTVAFFASRSPLFSSDSCFETDVDASIARLHFGPDVDVPLLQIARDTRIDRRVVESLHVARQHEFLLRFALGGRDN